MKNPIHQPDINSHSSSISIPRPPSWDIAYVAFAKGGEGGGELQALPREEGHARRMEKVVLKRWDGKPWKNHRKNHGKNHENHGKNHEHHGIEVRFHERWKR